MQKRWLWLSAPALVLTTALSWWMVRAATSDAARASQAGSADALASNADPRLREVADLLKNKNDPKSWDELVARYGRLAGDPSAAGVRTAILNALFSEPTLALRLKRVLDAVEADHTPAPQDPMWPELVNRLAQQWTDDVFEKGRDLMLMEKRPRARRALIASFAELAGSEQGDQLGAEQAQALLTDLIDMHAQAEPDQRPEIQEAVRKLGGNDPADLLAGNGITKGKKLELQVEYEKNLQAGIDTLMKGQPAQD
jgi:hypothetical protein